MSERNFTFLACPADLEDPTPAIGWLLQSNKQGWSNTAQFIAVNTKFKAPNGIRTFNVETNYPAELARLATHANWAKTGQPSPQQYRDALALFCLHRFAQAHPDIEQIVLITGSLSVDNGLSHLLETTSSKPFHWLDRDKKEAATTNPGQILFDRSNPDANAALNLALDIALTGAIYGLDPYSFEAFLDQSTSAAAIANAAFRLAKVD